MATVAEDQQWVRDQYRYLFAREPTPYELNHVVEALQSGRYTRARWAQEAESLEAEQAVSRIYMEIVGKPPQPEGVKYYADRLRSGQITRAQMREEMSAKTAENRRAQGTTATAPADTGAQEDAMAYLNGILADYGLGSLSGWAWEQIQSGHSPQRVIQDLRQTAEYKQRFAGMELRRANGFNAIDEGTYISLERSYRQMLRAAGLPQGMYDSPDDFARFIGRDVSPQEFQTRVNDLYVDAVQAASEVRTELARLYGTGANALIDSNQIAAFFMDPDRALPVLQEQWRAAINSGTALRSGYGQLTKDEAERLAELGITEEQAQQGFAFLFDARQLMQNLPGSGATGLSRTEGQEAVFGGNAQAQQRLRKVQETRVSEGSGGQAFAVGNQGVTAFRQETRS